MRALSWKRFLYGHDSPGSEVSPSLKCRSVAPAFSRGLRIQSQAILLEQRAGQEPAAVRNKRSSDEQPSAFCFALFLSLPHQVLLSFFQSLCFSVWRGVSCCFCPVCGPFHNACPLACIWLFWTQRPVLLFNFSPATQHLMFPVFQFSRDHND